MKRHQFPSSQSIGVRRRGFLQVIKISRNVISLCKKIWRSLIMSIPISIWYYTSGKNGLLVKSLSNIIHINFIYNKKNTLRTSNATNNISRDFYYLEKPPSTDPYWLAGRKLMTLHGIDIIRERHIFLHSRKKLWVNQLVWKL
jgi:hypothetical protein